MDRTVDINNNSVPIIPEPDLTYFLPNKPQQNKTGQWQ